MSVKDFTLPRNYSIVAAGVSWSGVQARLFRSEQDAIDALNKRRSFYEYWARPAGVQAENTEPVIVHVTY